MTQVNQENVAGTGTPTADGPSASRALDEAYTLKVNMLLENDREDLLGSLEQSYWEDVLAQAS